MYICYTTKIAKGNQMVEKPVVPKCRDAESDRCKPLGILVFAGFILNN